MEQRSEEWFAARCGKVTASRISDVMAKTKTGYSTSRANYCAQLVVERMTGKPAETFTNAAMQWGTDMEPQARDAYSAKVGELVDEVGFVLHPKFAQSGASPDGLVGDGLVEIKCPSTATHIETILTKWPAQKYVLQMQWQMACTERPWCDFVSFDPRMPEHLRLLIVRVNRDEELIRDIEREVASFLDEVETKVSLLMKEAA